LSLELHVKCVRSFGEKMLLVACISSFVQSFDLWEAGGKLLVKKIQLLPGLHEVA
jgi:hypothetical protein